MGGRMGNARRIVALGLAGLGYITNNTFTYGSFYAYEFIACWPKNNFKSKIFTLRVGKQ